MNDIVVQKETNMKFDGGFRNSQRADYEQFSQFIGLNRQSARREEIMNSTSNNCENPACTGDKHLAMVYPVKQEFCGIYDAEIALINGTIFEELNKPFYPTGCSNKTREGCL